MENTFLSHLKWRNAEKHFDPERKVAKEDLAKILEAVRFAPSSFGLQPYRVIVVSDPDLKLKLKEKGFGQAQFTDASEVFIFCSHSDVFARIEEYLELASGGDVEAKKNLEGYIGMMKQTFSGMSEEKMRSWSEKQAYLALGFGLAACAELGIDACPMEGFSATDFDQILGLAPEIRSCVVMTIGYRKNQPENAKVRFSEGDLFQQR